MKLNLLTKASATGDGHMWPGGTGLFTAAGTFGGATVKLQYLGPDGATWLDAGYDATLTAAGGALFDLPQVQIRAAVSGGTPSGLYSNATQA